MVICVLTKLKLDHFSKWSCQGSQAEGEAGGAQTRRRNFYDGGDLL